MMYRVLPLFVAVLALILLGGGVAVAQDKDTHEGTVVKAGNGKLVMTEKGSKTEHTHTIAPDAKILCDGKECKLEDLQKGYFVKVTTKPNDKTVAIRVEAHKEEPKK
jgi:hypothetical protein